VFFSWREYEEDWNARRRVGNAFHILDAPHVPAFDEALGQLGPQPDLHRLYDLLAAKQVPLDFTEPGFYDSNTLFGDRECTNPIYRIGNRPKLRRPTSIPTTLLKKVRWAMPTPIWRYLTHPRQRTVVAKRT
jgi:hypothetical protein